MADVARLNCELDEALVAYFDLFTEYQILHADLASRLKNGWWELGRARYAMGAGVNTLSQRQYPANMTATVHYHPEEGQSTGTATAAEEGGVQLHKRASAGEREESKRSTQEKADNEDDASNQPSSEASSNQDRERWKDPVNWFGVLHPPSLRVAQAEFKAAVQAACALTTIKRKLQAQQEHYDKLLEEKQQILDVHAKEASQ